MAAKRVQHALEYGFLKTVMFVVNVLPAAGAAAVGTFTGGLMYALWKRRRDIAHANLHFCFPDKDKAWVRTTARRSFINLAKSIIDFMRLQRLNAANLERYHTIVNVESFDAAAASGKGGVLLTGHFGSWELTGAGIRMRGYPIYFLVGQQHNPWVDREMNRLRASVSVGIIHMGVAAKGVFKALRENGMVALLSDQDAGEDGVIVKFFGRDASTPKGPAAFVLKTGATICAGFTVRDSRTHNTLYMEDAYHEESTGDSEADIRRVTQRYTAMLEKYIRRYPDHYHWLHRRFKTTYPELYAKPLRRA
jgi:KDO2-lipid IV(A) lauroyltransferase